MLASEALWEAFSAAEAVAFVAQYRGATHAGLSAADVLSWEAQQRLKARHVEVHILEQSPVNGK